MENVVVSSAFDASKTFDETVQGPFGLNAMSPPRDRAESRPRWAPDTPRRILSNLCRMQTSPECLFNLARITLLGHTSPNRRSRPPLYGSSGRRKI
jgi:hypothetical protein